MTPVPRARSRWLTRVGVAVAILVLMGYASAIVYLSVHEKSFLYVPGDRRVDPPAPQFALRERAVTYPSTDGAMLSAWIVPAGGERPSDMWLLICHGNFGNIGYGQRPEFYAFMRDIGVNLLAFDYRGFGRSSGSPEERGLYDDASASYEYLRRTLGVAADHIVIFGHSLGSGVAIELATRVPAAALIVEGAYASVVRMGQLRYPWLPVGMISTQRFPSIDRMASLRLPKLFLHSPEDAVIPYSEGRRLFDAALPPKRFVDVRGGHENAYRVDKSVYYGAIASLIRDVTPESISAPASSAADERR